MVLISDGRFAGKDNNSIQCQIRFDLIRYSQSAHIFSAIVNSGPSVRHTRTWSLHFARHDSDCFCWKHKFGQ